MLLRCGFLNFHLKTWVTVFGLLLSFLLSVLVYQILMGSSPFVYTPDLYPASPLSIIEKMLPVYAHEGNQSEGLQLLYKNSNSDSAQQEFWRDLMFANLFPKKSASFREKDTWTRNSRKVFTNFFRNLYPESLTGYPEAEETALDLKHLLFEHGFESGMSCRDIDSMRFISGISHTRSKTFELYSEANNNPGLKSNSVKSEGQHKSPYVVRSIFLSHTIMKDCEIQKIDRDTCAKREMYRLLRETLLLSTLKHPGVLLMQGYCLRGSRVSSVLQKKGLIIITERGKPLSRAIMDTSSWSQRISMALQVAELLLYLDNSPFGSLRFKKLNLNDFVLVRGTLVKLADLDDLELGIESCTEDSDCVLPRPQKGSQCVDGQCSGRNLAMNLRAAIETVLQPLLHHPEGKDEKALVAEIEIFNISATELVKRLKMCFYKNPPEGPIQYNESTAEYGEEKRREEDLGHYFKDKLDGRFYKEYKYAVAGNKKFEGFVLDALSSFERQDHKNTPRLYDYPCAGSRTEWGCVLTVTSLLDAANLCLSDPGCKSFVTFSNQPESERLLTVILKNGTSSSPDDSLTTTLFVRRPEADIRGRSDSRSSGVEAQGAQGGNTSVEKSWPEAESCLAQLMQGQVQIRSKREKKLMAHIGLKGITEVSWIKSATMDSTEDQFQFITSEGLGGKFVASSTRKIMFIAETGPLVSHMAYAVMYHLDRLLGLYHTPPCTSQRLSTDIVQLYLRNPHWGKIFEPFIDRDGTLSGVLVVPIPEVAKTTKVTLEPLKAMTSKLSIFDQSRKLQLEYVLLLWLARLDKNTDILRYKDHLIHFNADRAFTSLGVDMSAYLYHCQFPKDVYQSLGCFRCDTDGAYPQVCSLGQEVIKRTQAMFDDVPEISIHGFRKENLIASMNTAATSVLSIADACIRKYGSVDVLY